MFNLFENNHIFILIVMAIYIYLLFMVIQNDDYCSMVIMTLIVSIILCYRRRDNLKMENFNAEEFAYVDSKPQHQDSMPTYFGNTIKNLKNELKEDITEVQKYISGVVSDDKPIPIKNDPDLVYNNVSSYDGLCLTTGNKEFWSHSPNNVPLINDKNLHTIMGHTTSNKPVMSDPSSLSGPSLDGTEDTPNKLFMFSNNVSSPNCCPSTFSTSTGCVCTTDKQRDFVASRGFNSL